MNISAGQLLLLRQLDNIRDMAGLLLAICILGPLMTFLISGAAYNDHVMADKMFTKVARACGLVFLSNLLWICMLVFVPRTEDVLRAVCLSQIVDIKDPAELRDAHARALEMTRLLLLEKPDKPQPGPEGKSTEDNKEKNDERGD